MKLLIFLFIPSLAIAQPTKLDPSGLDWNDTKLANTISNITVGVSIGLDVFDSFRSLDKKRALIKQGERAVLVIGVTELVKRITHRNRPDNSDNLSFFSEHTEFASINKRFIISIPLSFGTGYLRIAANKHYLTDVIVGGIAGNLINHYVR